MPVIHDKEFGEITIRRSARASSVHVRMAPGGTFRVSTPLYTPLLFVRRMIASSRKELRTMRDNYTEQTTVFSDQMPIGKSHHLHVEATSEPHTTVRRAKQLITVRLARGDQLEFRDVQSKIREVVVTALRREAKSYLPKRLSYLARQHDYDYEKVRFSHASGRWGSCSSKGTISLNIALMKLPFALIDYVLIHELAHTKQMNHSSAFWQLVERADPDYKNNRKRIKQETPSL